MELTPILPVHNVVPLFTLPDTAGQRQNLARQRGREHLLLVVLSAAAAPQAYLERLAAQAPAWRELPARVIVVAGSAAIAATLRALPFTILVDEMGSVRAKFLPADAQAGVFALDRYGDLYQQWLVADPAALPAAVEIDGWLQAIAMQCSI